MAALPRPLAAAHSTSPPRDHQDAASPYDAMLRAAEVREARLRDQHTDLICFDDSPHPAQGAPFIATTQQWPYQESDSTASPASSSPRHRRSSGRNAAPEPADLPAPPPSLARPPRSSTHHAAASGDWPRTLSGQPREGSRSTTPAESTRAAFGGGEGRHAPSSSDRDTPDPSLSTSPSQPRPYADFSTEVDSRRPKTSKSYKLSKTSSLKHHFAAKDAVPEESLLTSIPSELDDEVDNMSRGHRTRDPSTEVDAATVNRRVSSEESEPMPMSGLSSFTKAHAAKAQAALSQARMFDRTLTGSKTRQLDRFDSAPDDSVMQDTVDSKSTTTPPTWNDPHANQFSPPHFDSAPLPAPIRRRKKSRNTTSSGGSSHNSLAFTGVEVERMTAHHGPGRVGAWARDALSSVPSNASGELPTSVIEELSSPYHQPMESEHPFSLSGGDEQHPEHDFQTGAQEGPMGLDDWHAHAMDEFLSFGGEASAAPGVDDEAQRHGTMLVSRFASEGHMDDEVFSRGGPGRQVQVDEVGSEGQLGMSQIGEQGEDWTGVNSERLDSIRLEKSPFLAEGHGSIAIPAEIADSWRDSESSGHAHNMLDSFTTQDSHSNHSAYQALPDELQTQRPNQINGRNEAYDDEEEDDVDTELGLSPIKEERTLELAAELANSSHSLRHPREVFDSMATPKTKSRKSFASRALGRNQARGAVGPPLVGLSLQDDAAAITNQNFHDSISDPTHMNDLNESMEISALPATTSLMADAMMSPTLDPGLALPPPMEMEDTMPHALMPLQQSRPRTRSSPSARSSRRHQSPLHQHLPPPISLPAHTRKHPPTDAVAREDIAEWESRTGLSERYSLPLHQLGKMPSNGFSNWIAKRLVGTGGEERRGVKDRWGNVWSLESHLLSPLTERTEDRTVTDGTSVISLSTRASALSLAPAAPIGHNSNSLHHMTTNSSASVSSDVVPTSQMSRFVTSNNSLAQRLNAAELYSLRLTRQHQRTTSIEGEEEEEEEEEVEVIDKIKEKAQRKERRKERRERRERRVRDDQVRAESLAEKQDRRRKEKAKKEKFLTNKQYLLNSLHQQPGDPILIRRLGALYLGSNGGVAGIKLAVRHLEASLQIADNDAECWRLLGHAWAALLESPDSEAYKPSSADRAQQAHNATIGFRKAIVNSTYETAVECKIDWANYLERRGRTIDALSVVQEACSNEGVHDPVAHIAHGDLIYRIVQSTELEFPPHEQIRLTFKAADELSLATEYLDDNFEAKQRGLRYLEEANDLVDHFRIPDVHRGAKCMTELPVKSTPTLASFAASDAGTESGPGRPPSRTDSDKDTLELLTKLTARRDGDDPLTESPQDIEPFSNNQEHVAEGSLIGDLDPEYDDLTHPQPQLDALESDSEAELDRHHHHQHSGAIDEDKLEREHEEHLGEDRDDDEETPQPPAAEHSPPSPPPLRFAEGSLDSMLPPMPSFDMIAQAPAPEALPRPGSRGTLSQPIISGPLTSPPLHHSADSPPHMSMPMPMQALFDQSNNGINTVPIGQASNLPDCRPETSPMHQEGSPMTSPHSRSGSITPQHGHQYEMDGRYEPLNEPEPDMGVPPSMRRNRGSTPSSSGSDLAHPDPLAVLLDLDRQYKFRLANMRRQLMELEDEHDRERLELLYRMQHQRSTAIESNLPPTRSHHQQNSGMSQHPTSMGMGGQFERMYGPTPNYTQVFPSSQSHEQQSMSIPTSMMQQPFQTPDLDRSPLRLGADGSHSSPSQASTSLHSHVTHSSIPAAPNSAISAPATTNLLNVLPPFHLVGQQQRPTPNGVTPSTNSVPLPPLSNGHHSTSPSSMSGVQQAGLVSTGHAEVALQGIMAILRLAQPHAGM